MSKINIYASVEDEFLKIATDKGWIKEAREQDMPDYAGGGARPRSTPPRTVSNPVQNDPGMAPGVAENEQFKAWFQTQSGFVGREGEKEGYKKWVELGRPKPAQTPPAQTPEMKFPVTKIPHSKKTMQNSLIGEVQVGLKELGYEPGTVDEAWGKHTADAWRKMSDWYKKNYGGDLGQFSVHNPPTPENMEFFVKQLVPSLKKKQPAAPSPVSTGPATPEHIPTTKADDGVLKEAAEQLTPKQKEVVTKVMKAKGLDLETAIQESKRLFPNVFAPAAPQPFSPKVPGWAQDKDPYDQMAEQLGKPIQMPTGEDIMKGVEEKMKGFKPTPGGQKGTDAIKVTAPKPGVGSGFSAVPEHIPSFKADDGLMTEAGFWQATPNWEKMTKKLEKKLWDNLPEPVARGVFMLLEHKLSKLSSGPEGNPEEEFYALENMTDKIIEQYRTNPAELIKNLLGSKLPLAADKVKLETELRKHILDDSIKSKRPEEHKEAAFVINQLISLANDLDSMGEIEAANAIDNQMMMYKEAVDKLYDITGETGEKFYGTAHESGPVMAPAKDEGGKVENLLEQQKKDLEVAKKQPTGKEAAMLIRLIATANKLDAQGDTEGARIVDKAILELRERVLPFANRNAASEAARSEDQKASGIKSTAGATFFPGSDTLMNDIESLTVRAEKVGENFIAAKAHSVRFVNALNSYKDKIYNARELYNKALDKKSLSAYAKVLKDFMNDLYKGSMKGLWDALQNVVGVGFNRMKLNQHYTTLAQSLSASVEEVGEALKAGGIPEDSGTQQNRQQGQGQQQGQGGESTGTMKELREREYNKYVGTLNSLEQSIKNNDRAVEQAFGADGVPAWLKGIEEERELAKKYDWKKLRQTNDAIYNRVVPYLKSKKIWASQKIVMKKQAAGLADLISKIPAPAPAAQKGKATPGKGKGHGGGGARRAGDPQVKELQEALINSGTSIGPRGADGFWGPETLKGWNNFVKKVEQASGGRPTRLSAKTSPKTPPSPDEMEIAKRWAAHMRQQTEQTLNVVEFEIKGKKFNSNDLKEPNAFLAAMAREGLLVTNYEKLKKEQIIPVVSKNLGELSNSLRSGEQGAYIKNTYGEAVHRNLAQSINDLWLQFKQDAWQPGKPAAGGTTMEQLEGQKGREGAPGGAPGASGGAGYMGPMGGGNLNSPEGALTALYQMVGRFKDTDVEMFKHELETQNKKPDQFLREQYALLGKIGNALRTQQGNIRNKWSNEKYQDAFQDYKELYATIQQLAAGLNASLAAQKAQPQAAPTVPGGIRGVIPMQPQPHEAETGRRF